jgi:hypothetical protein
VTIGAEGEVTRADIVSGPSLLASYALENIETWKFEPLSKKQQDETVFEFVYKIEEGVSTLLCKRPGFVFGDGCARGTVPSLAQRCIKDSALS